MHRHGGDDSEEEVVLGRSRTRTRHHAIPLQDMPGAKGFRWRHVHVILLFWSITMAYIFRINISVCIVEMTNKNSTSGFPVYPWTENQQDLILSAFFWGYVLMQVPAGMLAQRYGPKWFMLLGVAGCSLLSALSPLAASWGGWQLLCACRVLQGLVQGFIYPCTHTMLSRWVPPVERARWSSFVYNGISVGTVISMFATGQLSGSSLGWPSAFYVPGLLGIAWAVAWVALTSNSPFSAPRVSLAEKEYIERAFEGTCRTGETRLSVPWIRIITSPRMWALIVVHCGQNFGHWILLTKIPTYMKTVLGFDISSNGLYSALPYLWLTLTSLSVSYISQVVNENRRIPISRTFSRKMFNSLAHWGSGTTLLVLGFLHPTEFVAVALLMVAVGFEAGTLAGYLVNHMDLSPNFGGAMMGITNCLASFVAIMAPLLVGQITGGTLSTEEQAHRWNIVFIMSAGVYFIGNLIFVIFGSAEVQPWNNPTPTTSYAVLIDHDESA